MGKRNGYVLIIKGCRVVSEAFCAECGVAAMGNFAPEMALLGAEWETRRGIRPRKGVQMWT